MEDRWRNLLVAAIAFVGFWLCYLLGWLLCERYSTTFNKLATPAAKADWSSRVSHSTVHAVLVCCLVYACVATIDFNGPGHSPTNDDTLAQILFSISIGYFAMDLCVCLWWLLPMWSVFLVHHLVALTPYAISNFYQTCSFGMYELVLFLLVETSTVPLNAVNLYELAGMENSRGHNISFFVLFASWFVFRVVLPIYLLVCVWVYAFPHVNSEAYCLVPAMICAHLIVFFCVYVFASVLVPDFMRRIRRGDEVTAKRPLSLSACHDSGETKTDQTELEGLEFSASASSASALNSRSIGDGNDVSFGSVKRNSRNNLAKVGESGVATVLPKGGVGVMISRNGVGGSSDADHNDGEIRVSNVPYRAMDEEGQQRAAAWRNHGAQDLTIEAGNEPQFETFAALLSAGPRAWANAFGRDLHIPHEESGAPSPVGTPLQHQNSFENGEQQQLGTPGAIARTPSAYLR